MPHPDPSVNSHQLGSHAFPKAPRHKLGTNQQVKAPVVHPEPLLAHSPRCHPTLDTGYPTTPSSSPHYGQPFSPSSSYKRQTRPQHSHHDRHATTNEHDRHATITRASVLTLERQEDKSPITLTGTEANKSMGKGGGGKPANRSGATNGGAPVELLKEFNCN